MSGIATLYMCIQLSCTDCCSCVHCMTTHCTQGYQKVPETPLASCQVLRDEAEVWMDVQVGQLYTLRTTLCSDLQFHSSCTQTEIFCLGTRLC